MFLTIAGTDVSISDVFDRVKDWFSGDQWNPFASWPFCFQKGLEDIIFIILAVGLVQFILKIKKAIF